MVQRRALEIGALVWAMVAFVVSAASLATTGSAPVLVALATVVFPLCAVMASLALARGRPRIAGVLLLASVATPTYFAWIVNVPALLVGLALVTAPRLVLKPSPAAGSGAWGAT